MKCSARVNAKEARPSQIRQTFDMQPISEQPQNLNDSLLDTIMLLFCLLFVSFNF